MHISTLSGHERMSTRELLQTIAQAIEQGETEFQISASGQHDIGGPIWSPSGKEINIRIHNPGQRAGSMCLAGTRVVVDGPAPADVGWLNSGGEITVKGDAGDTAGHCAAAGRIYIGGRAGTRTGSLMKHDPEQEPPELWILENTGSFSFEFMGGGRAIICGHNCLNLPSVLGARPGVGMVGGVVYFRGHVSDLPPDVVVAELEQEDIDFLDKGLDRFLEALGHSVLKRDLSIWKHWHKLVPATSSHKPASQSIKNFHSEKWIASGIFGDIYKDDKQTVALAPAGSARLRNAIWSGPELCTDCGLCLRNCPQTAIRRRQKTETVYYNITEHRCIGCGICAAACPQHLWQMTPASFQH